MAPGSGPGERRREVAPGSGAGVAPGSGAGAWPGVAPGSSAGEWPRGVARSGPWIRAGIRRRSRPQQYGPPGHGRLRTAPLGLTASPSCRLRMGAVLSGARQGRPPIPHRRSGRPRSWEPLRWCRRPEASVNRAPRARVRVGAGLNASPRSRTVCITPPPPVFGRNRQRGWNQGSASLARRIDPAAL